MCCNGKRWWWKYWIVGHGRKSLAWLTYQAGTPGALRVAITHEMSNYESFSFDHCGVEQLLRRESFLEFRLLQFVIVAVHRHRGVIGEPAQYCILQCQTSVFHSNIDMVDGKICITPNICRPRDTKVSCIFVQK